VRQEYIVVVVAVEAGVVAGAAAAAPAVPAVPAAPGLLRLGDWGPCGGRLLGLAQLLDQEALVTSLLVRTEIRQRNV